MLIFDAGEPINTEGMQLYSKKKLKLHAIKTETLAPKGTALCVHTLEGDQYVEAGSDFYVMVGWKQEVYPVMSSYFDTKYRFITAEEAGETREDYAKLAAALSGLIEIVRCDASKERVMLTTGSLQSIILDKNSYVLAREIPEDFQVITHNEFGGVFFGNAGAFLVCDRDGLTNLRIVDHESMEATYELVNS